MISGGVQQTGARFEVVCKHCVHWDRAKYVKKYLATKEQRELETWHLEQIGSPNHKYGMCNRPKYSLSPIWGNSIEWCFEPKFARKKVLETYLIIKKVGLFLVFLPVLAPIFLGFMTYRFLGTHWGWCLGSIVISYCIVVPLGIDIAKVIDGIAELLSDIHDAAKKINSI